MSAARRLTGFLVALALALAPSWAVGGAAARPTIEGAAALERCLARIALFDEIIISRFDHRLLAIERRQLEEARTLRHQAQAKCATGRLWFGLNDIERALILIGVPPSFGPGETDADAEGSGL